LRSFSFTVTLMSSAGSVADGLIETSSLLITSNIRFE
jgi:hypothetical protein